MQFKPAHFPGRAPIDAYGDGGFRFADMSHRGSILCLPSGIHAWNAEDASSLTPASFEPVLVESGIELLLIGTGQFLVPLPAAVTEGLRAADIRIEFMATGAAARTFNVLLAEERAVAAALLATE